VGRIRVRGRCCSVGPAKEASWKHTYGLLLDGASLPALTEKPIQTHWETMSFQFPSAALAQVCNMDLPK
jgi:hypothetical protein